MVVFLYRFTHRGLHYERSFLVTLLLISPIVSLVMLLIGGSLPHSLGMVGALSLIRFRTIIKDTRDMVYLFWAIAIGLGCGTFNWSIISIASVFLAFMILVLHFARYGESMHADYSLVISGEGQPKVRDIISLLKKYVTSSIVRSIEVQDAHWEVVMELRMFKDENQKENDLIHDIKTLADVHKVSLLVPQLSLPV